MTATARAEPDMMTPTEGLKETAESILVALILAFVFRAFVVEAFVIPTGSMAPTLYGAHGTIVCEECGREFAYGLRDLDDARRSQLVGPSSDAICPNCNHRNTRLPINDVRQNPEKGDRILVLKWPFDIGGELLGPKRWDVVVFKDPADGTTNFIKRLVGLPGEVLLILDGDVYTADLSALPEDVLAALEKQRHLKYEFRTDTRVGLLPNLPESTLRELDDVLTIARKSPAAQSALWRTVYDHDHLPRTLEAVQPSWQRRLEDGSGWDAAHRTISFSFAGESNDYISLNGKPIRADTAYNVNYRGRPPPVADLRIRLVWTPVDSEAGFQIQLNKLFDMFWASIRADGTIILKRSNSLAPTSAKPMATAQLAPFPPGDPVQVSFENVDYRLAIRINGKEVLTSSSDAESPAYYGPHVNDLRRMSQDGFLRRRQVHPPRLYGDGGSFTLSHIVLDRDIYYYHDRNGRGLGRLPWAPASGWASLVSPMMLRSDEYFMLGDNTAASKDSRLWDTTGEHLTDRGEAFQLGTVPRDQLIGKAFFVYWPSGHRLSWLPLPVIKDIRFIPDVGRMRWIR